MTGKRKPRIAIIGAKGIPSRVDGLEVYIDEICTRLIDDFEMVVYCRKRYCDEVVRNYKGVQVVHVPSINTKHLDAVSYGFFATIMALTSKADLLWYHAMGSAIWEWIPKLFNKKILSTVHGLDWKRERFGRISSKLVRIGEMNIAKCSTEIITLNPSDAKHFQDKWFRKSYVIHNGVNLPEVEQIELKEKYFLFASRIAPEKDVKTLISAYNKLSTSTKLYIAGKGTHTNSYEKEVRTLAKDNDGIVFCGYVTGKRLEELYRNAYAYILPSTIEGQSIGLLEAMSYGLPCLVSDIDENKSVIMDAGYTFKKGDAMKLAEQLVFMDNHQSEIEEMGKKARIRVMQNYGLDATVRQTRSVIDEMIKSNLA